MTSRSSLLSFALLVQLAVGVVAAPASAQCATQWLRGLGFPGTNGYVHATTSWDPDGPGPYATCWRRLRMWEEHDVWKDVWRAVLGALDAPDPRASSRSGVPNAGNGRSAPTALRSRACSPGAIAGLRTRSFPAAP